MQDVFLIAGGIVLVIVLLMVGISSIWRKVPQDKAVVVSGLRKRVITGGGGLVVPLFERTDVISLENMKIEVRIDGALTEQGVEVFVDGVSVVKVRSDLHSILQAMEQFNTGREGTTIEAIRNTVRDVLEGKLREIISKLTVEEIYKDREKFASEVEAVASVALAEMGLEIKAFTIRDIADKNQYLESLGKKQIAQVKKDAVIAEAEANREATERTAEASRLAKEAQIAAETRVAEASKEKQLKVEAYRQEQEAARAKADNSYAIQENIVRQEVAKSEIQVEIVRREKEVELTERAMQVEIVRREKEIELTERAMQVEITKRLKETELAEQEAIRRERELDATVRKQAEAELYEREQRADAAKYAEIKDAEAKAEMVRLDGLARAEAIRAAGMAEVDIIREKGKAEAEAMMKKAEAYRMYNEAAVLQMIVEKLPQIAEQVAAPLAKTEKIVMIGDAGSKMTRSITDIIAQVPEVAQALTGVDIKQLISGYASKKAEG